MNGPGDTTRQPLLPRGLSEGDTVAVIAPASQVKPGSEEALELGLDWIRAQGLAVRLMPHSAARHGELPFLAGDDDARLADLHAAFADPEIDAIACVRGGWGSPRLLPALDFGLIEANPKVFVGYSDLTGLMLPIQQRTGLVTFHGPMVAPNLGVEEWQQSELAVRSLVRCLRAGGKPPGPLSQGQPEWTGQTLVAGTAEGTVIGGNGTLIQALLGTPYGLDDTPGRILLIEEIGESPYRLDRLLTHLRLAGKLQSLAGIALGQFTEVDEADRPHMEAVFRDRLTDLGVPVATGLPFGHDNPCACVPLGVTARLEAREDGTADLVFDQPCVSER